MEEQEKLARIQRRIEQIKKEKKRGKIIIFIENEKIQGTEIIINDKYYD